jgi:hypothetical protein
MDKLLVALAILVTMVPHPARGQSLTQLPARRALGPGERMKKHGIAATILGCIQLAVGGIAGAGALISGAQCKRSGCIEDGGAMVAIAAGSTFTLLGAISATAGIPMWIYGAREERAAKAALSATANGVRLTF